MGRLTDIGNGYGTDKAEHHGFTQFYEEYFKKFSRPNILEVGILDGASLKMYDDYYFKEARVVGIDINEKGHLKTPTTTIIQGDIMQDKAIEQCRNAIPKGELYDIIIDDGGHYMEQQQVTLVNLWELLKPGGIFIVEDLHTSGIPEYNPHNTTTTLDLLNGMRDKEFKHSMYLTIRQQKELAADMSEIKIWSKDRSDQYGRPQNPSITSVIIKKGELSNKSSVDDMVEIQQEPETNVAENESTETHIHPAIKPTGNPSNRFKKEISVFEHKNQQPEALQSVSKQSSFQPEIVKPENKILEELDLIQNTLEITQDVLGNLLTRIAEIKKSL